MPTNVYLNNYNAKNEQDLYEELIGEVVKTWGVDSYYLPRSTNGEFDLLYGEDPTKKYSAAYPVEVYIDEVDRFDGGELFSKFGLEIRKEIRFIMPNRAFKKVVPSVSALRPREGDLIWLPVFEALFEIRYVDEEHFFYTFGKKDFYGFKLHCEKFRYSDEKLDTGIVKIDQIEDTSAKVYRYMMAAGGSATFEPSEMVYQGNSLITATASGQVALWDINTRSLLLKNVKGTFGSGLLVKGAISQAAYVLQSVDILDDANDLLDDNRRIQDEANEILDFSENNPFGEV